MAHIVMVQPILHPLAVLRLAARGNFKIGQQGGTDAHGFVEMETAFGGRRLVDWLSGEQLPRIC